ncbi:MAG: GGDEF domain-containing protein [Planctomycetaceae bacterium]
MKHRQPMAGLRSGHRSPSRLSSRMTFLGVISWLSVCLILVGLFPEVSASLGGMWLMAGLFGLAAAVGLGEAAKTEVRVQNDLLSNYLSEARTDALTGLGNRRAFDGDCQYWQDDWRRGRQIALLLIDVDRFKQFNDRYGHQAGDEMLRAVARVLKFESAEVGTAIRYGGEEFAVVLLDTDLSRAIAWAEDARQRIAAERISFRSVELSVTVSIGVTVSQSIDTAESLVVRADEQLYLAKAGGRNSTRPCPPAADHLDRLLASVQPAPAFAEHV